MWSVKLSNKIPKKIFFQIFQKINFQSPVKGSRPLLPPQTAYILPDIYHKVYPKM